MKSSGTFRLRENIYNQYLDELWAINEQTLAIVMRSSRHPGINTLLFYDLSRNEIVGMREFSKFQSLTSREHFGWHRQ